MAAREISCVEVMTAFLDRIERINPAINAIVSLRPRHELLAEAQAPPTHAPREGRCTACLSPSRIWWRRQASARRTARRSFADHVPEHDELLAARIRAAGAILIGKTNTPEFGLGSHSFNPVTA